MHHAKQSLQGSALLDVLKASEEKKTVSQLPKSSIRERMRMKQTYQSKTTREDEIPTPTASHENINPNVMPVSE